MSEHNQNESQTDPVSSPLTDHEYDGIREYDNPIPGWWAWIFAGTCIFAVLYYMAYQLGTAGTSVSQAYENDNEKEKIKMVAKLGTMSVDEPNILKYLYDEEMMPVGRGVFRQNCAVCHGTEGQGVTGPNFTDDQYKNVKRLGDIGHVIEVGVANTAMLGWKGRIHPNEIVLVSAYVASLRGQNLSGPLGPQGEIIPPWPDASQIPEAAVEPGE